jgi:hypothetical protein
MLAGSNLSALLATGAADAITPEGAGRAAG